MSMDKVFGSFSSTPYEAMQDWFTTEFLPAYEQSGDTLNTDDWKAVVGLFQHMNVYHCTGTTAMAEGYFEHPTIARIVTHMSALSHALGTLITRCKENAQYVQP